VAVEQREHGQDEHEPAAQPRGAYGQPGAEYEGRPPVAVRPGLLQAATWRAARSGLEGDLVDPVTATAVPAGRLIGQLLTGLRPALEAAGDWDFVAELTRSALARGSSAARQRAARASGGLRHVVDTLVAESRTTPPCGARLLDLACLPR
jgi:gamma-glutamyl:cysteine ligase YbdK (ATP-grasp superfamily)